MVEPLPEIPPRDMAKKTVTDGLAIFFAMIAVAQFGTAYVAAKFALRGLPPFTAAAARFIFWYTALSRLEASQTAVFLFFVPIISVVLSFIVLGESLTVYLIAGAVLVLSGAYLTSWSNGKGATRVVSLRRLVR